MGYSEGTGWTVTVIHCSGPVVAQQQQAVAAERSPVSLLITAEQRQLYALITVCGGKMGAVRTQKEVFFPMRT